MMMALKRLPFGASLMERLLHHRIIADSGCWLWNGSINHRGYGRMIVGRKVEYAHRIAYRVFVGDIPTGKELDHLCRNRRCFNPQHLEPVTHAVNVSRGAWGDRGRSTHCPHGHEFTHENTYWLPSRPRVRRCNECKREQDRASYATRRKYGK